ncbi:MAG TPA: HAMP domain-containing sensor histidine kinase [Ignavibacteriaceae bacterium]|nr:HAMP domain-containing sensor histidine kinase [Ignavibacteriaceae bacterium]
MSGGPASVNIKVILLVIAVLIAIGTLYYTQTLVQKLQEKERQIVELYAKGIEYLANTTNPDVDITFLFDNIIKPIDFPLIQSDAENNVHYVRNVEIDSNMTDEQFKFFMAELISEMDETHLPIEVKYEGMTINKIHYGDSEHIKQLRYYPYIQLAIAALFIIIGYISFSSIKRSEQSNIWVGMAKETAHQFGTPISSLMGWLEMLKINYKEPDKVLDVTEEISNDVEKLNKITYRFSKIGAKPELAKKNVIEEMKQVVAYFERRLPQTGKTVELKIIGDESACAEINSELFEWVIENLIKNALDAIEGTSGKIEISVKEFKKRVEVEVTDSGKGIEMKRRKDVFRPGYSTKKRGWGLGLSLSKRIIEGYHGGKIFVKSSMPGEGTTFKIILKSC